LKLVAIILSAALCIFTGIYNAFKLKFRCDELGVWGSVSLKIKESMGFSKTDVREILLSIPENELPYSLNTVLQTDMALGLYKAFDRIRTDCENSSFLLKKDWALIESFLLNLGKSGLENQLGLCDRFICELTDLRKEATDRCSKYFRLYVTAGIAVGGLIVVMML